MATPKLSDQVRLLKKVAELADQIINFDQYAYTSAPTAYENRDWLKAEYARARAAAGLPVKKI